MARNLLSRKRKHLICAWLGGYESWGGMHHIVFDDGDERDFVLSRVEIRPFDHAGGIKRQPNIFNWEEALDMRSIRRFLNNASVCRQASV